MTDNNVVTLLVDTGSSNTWVGAATPYTETSTSQDTGDEVVRTIIQNAFSCCLNFLLVRRIWLRFLLGHVKPATF